MNQIALPLDISSSFEDGSYVVTAANAELEQQIQDWQNWPNNTAILIGPLRSGKSTIAKRFERDSGGYIVDDAADLEENQLFHLWNRAKGEGRPLLMVSAKPVAEWNVTLPDLKSRLASSILLEIAEPDDDLAKGLLQKYFTLRGLSITEDALSYLIKRMDRTYDNILNLAQIMDSLAIERKKPITRDIAKLALSDIEARSGERPDFPAAPNNMEKR